MKLVKLVSLVGAVSIALLSGCAGADGKDGTAGGNGENGQQGKDGNPTKASPNALSPAVGFLGREIEVHLGFDGTSFDAANPPKVEFGAGIKVQDVKVASATLLKVKVLIDRTAAPGPKDVTIGEVVAKGAFEVKPSLKLDEAVPAEQGGLGAVLISNLDTAVFDTNQGGFAGVADGLVPFSTSASGPYAAQAIFLVPPMASGNIQYAAANLDAVGEPALMFYSAVDAIKLKTRAPTTLAFGTPKPAEAFTGAFGSKLYKFSTPANKMSIVSFAMHVEEGTTSLGATLFGAGGTAKDVLARLDAVEDSIFGPMPKEAPYDHNVVLPLDSQAAKDYFLSIVDTSGDKANKFDLTPITVDAALLTEAAAAHETVATAQALTIVTAANGGNILKGEVKDEKALYYFKTTVAANERLEVGLDAPAGGLVGIGKPNATDATKASFVAVAPEGKLTAAMNAAGDLPAGTAYIAVAGLKGKYTLSIRRLAK